MAVRCLLFRFLLGVVSGKLVDSGSAYRSPLNSNFNLYDIKTPKDSKNFKAQPCHFIFNSSWYDLSTAADSLLPSYYQS